ncbi:unnamed protein product [Schistosoma mansoni]|uniref:Smp_206260 n=1 Tax=Schistosoma mansoni TaxID=6183 RepID=UPI00022C874C|nr:unnamed protein product [Schistosoma mansoni]|eukprot:XP_018644827.1 unnamed protein product [Schistosoma mansoni]
MSLVMSFILTHRLLLYDSPFLSYTQSINYCSLYSQPHLTKSCRNIVFFYMVRCDQFDWYINPICLRMIIHIAEAVIDVLDLTGWARQKAGLVIRFSCIITHCSLIGGLITSY